MRRSAFIIIFYLSTVWLQWEGLSKQIFLETRVTERFYLTARWILFLAHMRTWETIDLIKVAQIVDSKPSRRKRSPLLRRVPFVMPSSLVQSYFTGAGAEFSVVSISRPLRTVPFERALIG